MSTVNVISVNLPILRELCDRMGQLALAQKVGVSRRTIARIEKAEVADPGVDLMTRIGSELGVTLPVLTERTLRAVTLALPEDVCTLLASPQGPQTLEAMIRAARHPR